jgi:hypothetical protein
MKKKSSFLLFAEHLFLCLLKKVVNLKASETSISKLFKTLFISNRLNDNLPLILKVGINSSTRNCKLVVQNCCAKHYLYQKSKTQILCWPLVCSFFSICNYSCTKYYLTQSLQVESELKEKVNKEKTIQCKR